VLSRLALGVNVSYGRFSLFQCPSPLVSLFLTSVKVKITWMDTNTRTDQSNSDFFTALTFCACSKDVVVTPLAPTGATITVRAAKGEDGLREGTFECSRQSRGIPLSRIRERYWPIFEQACNFEVVEANLSRHRASCHQNRDTESHHVHAMGCFLFPSFSRIQPDERRKIQQVASTGGSAIPVTQWGQHVQAQRSAPKSKNEINK
jgi:hypothetical protein